MLLHEAVEVAPEIAPRLALGAVTRMRRGELVGLRRFRIRWDEHRILVDSAMSGTRVKSTKTRRERSLYIPALRTFTSSELLDAGFNVSMVAQRQGHGPQVLVKHYAKSRRSSDRKAAEHLGRLVHETHSAGGVPATD